MKIAHSTVCVESGLKMVHNGSGICQRGPSATEQHPVLCPESFEAVFEKCSPFGGRIEIEIE